MTAPATAPVPTMTQAQALEFRAGRDQMARELNRKPRAELARLEAAGLAAAGRQRLSGGPHSKDELIASILEFRYPLARLNESIHVLYHDGGGGSSACQFCHPRHGDRCDCELGRP